MPRVVQPGKLKQEASRLIGDGSKHQLLFGEALSAACHFEQRRAQREKISATGRLAYGGTAQGLVGCRIIDLSDTGARIETYVRLDPGLELFTFEYGGIYCRARRRWAKDFELGLEFIYDASEAGI